MMVAHVKVGPDDAVSALAPLDGLAAGGVAIHPHYRRLLVDTAPSSARNLADFVHCLCKLHGCHPTMIETALGRIGAGPQRDWAMASAAAFEQERHYLVTLTAAVGPLPSTSGAAQTENTLKAQQHAIDTLGRSERNGCALGAASALVADWAALRALLDHVAARHGVEAPACALPEPAQGEAMRDRLEGAGPRRAFAFGAEQLLLQHAGLFDLLEARAEARDKADGIG
ncbi:DUF6975 family protein [Sphingomicrobium astaxanthinifaciens]|uniref:DUF6975 family protein n=1 Tax=Sphingomicrobium astaxanthinifaciens TaxID=1227949 RepID=UPI001FCB89A2|nr:hypothetical protein [Sphingomicrobium astaxanthinifaciens]MCJ7422320.1 hypothetical protein [Sphingomicrobium astaxanthinifaciens]